MNILLTNNPLAAARSADRWDVKFFDDAAIAVLTAARDYIHCGHKLLTHPLASSIPPKDSPFRSVLISGDVSGTDFDSVRIIESAINVYAKLTVTHTNIPQNIAEDFMAIDCDVILGR